MRKLSMKNPGTPEIEDSSASGRDGVSVDGGWAGLCARAPAGEEPPVASVWAPGAAPPFDFRRDRVAPTVLPCERWTLIRGVAPASGTPAPAGDGAVAP